MAATLTAQQVSNLAFTTEVRTAMGEEPNPVAFDLLSRLTELRSDITPADLAALDWDFAGTVMHTKDIAWLLRNMESSARTHAVGDMLADIIAPHLA